MASVTEIIWLIGAAEDLPSKPLVTNHEVLKGLFFLRNVKKQPLPKCITNVVDRIHEESQRIGFLTLNKKTIRPKIQRMLAEYDKIRKNRGVQSERQSERERKFSEMLKETFKCFIDSPSETCALTETATSETIGIRHPQNLK
jgi:hypothetical protein